MNGVQMSKLETIIDPAVLHKLTDDNVIGIDIGSRAGKAVLLSGGNYYTATVPTGINMQETAHELLEEIFEASGLQRADIDFIVGTGYGRVALTFPDIPSKIVTEISAHSLGAHYLNTKVQTILDIGGQDSKAIKVDTATGKVAAFVMNDKCAAGTGRFLEKVAGILELELDALGWESVKGSKPSEISSQCVVFAESEVISLRARGETVQNISAGIHLASARRVRSLLSRVGIEKEVIFSGGVSNNVGMRKAVEEILGYPLVKVPIDTVFAGALGAAIHAQQLVSTERTVVAVDNVSSLDLTELKDKIAAHHERILKPENHIKKVGYLCTYTPLELINASGAAHLRLYKAGNSEKWPAASRSPRRSSATSPSPSWAPSRKVIRCTARWTRSTRSTPATASRRWARPSATSSSRRRSTTPHACATRRPRGTSTSPRSCISRRTSRSSPAWRSPKRPCERRSRHTTRSVPCSRTSPSCASATIPPSPAPTSWN